MKTLRVLPFVFVILVIGTIACPASSRKKALLLISQGKENFTRDNPRAEQVLCLREEMASLIKEGNTPVVIEHDKGVAWIYLNDTESPRDYHEISFDSDYFEIIVDLFPLKINKKLKKKLKKGNKAFMDELGIEYLVENGEVISKIDYEKFEQYVF